MEKPVLNMNAFRISGFCKGTFLVMLTFAITMFSIVQNGLLIPVVMAGVALLPGGMMNTIFSLVSGCLYDNIGAKN